MMVQVGKCDLVGLDMAGASLVHSAAKGGNGAILQKVLDLGGNESAVTSSGRTCLHYAAHGEAESSSCSCAKISPALAHSAIVQKLPKILNEKGLVWSRWACGYGRLAAEARRGAKPQGWCWRHPSNGGNRDRRP